jgi:hypothetical protein
MCKTIKVNEITDIINEKLANPVIEQLTKATLCTFLEDILHKTSNYHGYNYLYWLNHPCGYTQWVKDGEPGFPEKEKYITNNKKEEFSRVYYTRR